VLLFYDLINYCFALAESIAGGNPSRVVVYGGSASHWDSKGDDWDLLCSQNEVPHSFCLKAIFWQYLLP